MDRSRKDPSDERGGEIIANETEGACEDGACSWHDNMPAQSEDRDDKG